MMRLRSVLSTCVVLLSLTVVGRGESLNFLSETAIDPVQLLPAPPPPNSGEYAAEMATVLSQQEQRTQEQVAECRAEVKLTMAAFERVMGPWFTANNLPKLNGLFKKVEQDAKYFSDLGKRRFGRPRPAAVDARVKVAVDPETSPAYPGGHACRGIVYAMILAEFAPEQRAALLERGREIGWNRVIGGVHYPSDIVAGRVLGQAVGQALLANPKFLAELNEVKAEFDAVPKDATSSASSDPSARQQKP